MKNDQLEMPSYQCTDKRRESGRRERFPGGAGYPFKNGWMRESDLSVWAEFLCLDGTSNG